MRNYLINEYKIDLRDLKQEHFKLVYKILNIYFFIREPYIYQSFYKSFCVRTWHKRSVENYFLLNRMFIKKYLILGRLSGLNKIS